MTGSFSSGSSGSGAVDSVNGQTGAVTITAAGLNVNTQHEAVINNSGNSTISPTDGVCDYNGVVTVGGSGRTSVLILATANRNAGDKVRLVIALPATAGITIEVRNATSGGSLLGTFVSSSLEELEGLFDGEYSGSAWAKQFVNTATI